MPKPLKYRVFLTSQDRSRLERVVKTGSHPAQLIVRARVLLEVDENVGPVAFRAEP